MKKRLLWTILLTMILGLMWVSSLSQALSTIPINNGNFERTYNFDVWYGHHRSTHTLYVSVPTSLYEYYNSRSHVISGDSDYAKYATPSVFKSIAENIQKTTNNTPYSDEQFANAVLTMVRQIPYNKSSVKYPVEAIVENTGDCDVLSLLAASIMKAGGLDVVLFLYKGLNPSHMNIGVYLPYKPVYRSWWITPIGFEYNNKTYWIAEATSLGQWKVGERPELTANSKAYVIPLNNSQKESPGQVSSNLDAPLLSSAISMTLSSDNSSLGEETRPLTISGAISPVLPNKTVTMYVSQGKSTQVFKTTTDEYGNYSFNWNLTTTSTYQIQTSSTDISNFTGADSEKLSVFGSYRPLNTDYEFGYSSSYSADGAINRASMTGFGDFINQGVKEFLKSNVTGTGALLSGEFIVLDSNETEKRKEPIIMPVERFISLPRSRWPVKIIIQEEILPPAIPNGQFGFMLQQNDDSNYSASVRILQNQDVSKITTQLDENDTAFMNASQITKENTWYKVTATISENSTHATLYEENGTPLDHITPRNETETASQISVLLTFNPGAVIVFRNLKVEALDKAEPAVISTQSLENKSEPPAIIGVVTIVIVATVAIALLRRKRRSKK